MPWTKENNELDRQQARAGFERPLAFVCHDYSQLAPAVQSAVALTHAGKVLMEESRRLLANVNQALARVEQIGRGEAGRIELG
ncbi:hypothetical protein MJN47_28250, partial [Salmonella enterica subsp. enterica serovar Lubbock]|nr:hypothetical protein [Salmonella enterica subsp. enterica serovar Lubbock]